MQFKVKSPSGVETTFELSKLASIWGMAVTFNKTVYLPKIIYEDIMRSNYPTDKNDIVIHELTHVDQQSKGPYRWVLKYFFSRKFRREAEFEAYFNQWVFRLKRDKKEEMPQMMKAYYYKLLTSWKYGWMAAGWQVLGLFRKIEDELK